MSLVHKIIMSMNKTDFWVLPVVHLCVTCAKVVKAASASLAVKQLNQVGGAAAEQILQLSISRIGAPAPFVSVRSRKMRFFTDAKAVCGRSLPRGGRPECAHRVNCMHWVNNGRRTKASERRASGAMSHGLPALFTHNGTACDTCCVFVKVEKKNNQRDWRCLS